MHGLGLCSYFPARPLPTYSGKSPMYSINRVHWAAAKGKEPIVCEKSGTLGYCHAKEAYCTRKIEYIGPLRRESSLLYSKNRVHWATVMRKEPIILEKSSTLAHCGAKGAYCTRKIEYIGPLRRESRLLYAKNRVHWPTAERKEPIVLEKSSTLGHSEGIYCARHWLLASI
jgi:hypothetical protein